MLALRVTYMESDKKGLPTQTPSQTGNKEESVNHVESPDDDSDNDAVQPIVFATATLFVLSAGVVVTTWFSCGKWGYSCYCCRFISIIKRGNHKSRLSRSTAGANSCLKESFDNDHEV